MDDPVDDPLGKVRVVQCTLMNYENVLLCPSRKFIVLVSQICFPEQKKILL